MYIWQPLPQAGIAREMVKMLFDEARNQGVTEISLDATEDGRLLYQNLGFADSVECMVLKLGTRKI